MFNVGAADSSDFKLGYDMKSKRPFIASKSPKMDSDTFKTIVYLDEDLPTFGINEGVKYKATKALNKNKNFNGFMDYLNQRGKGKQFIDSMTDLPEDMQTTVWKEIQSTGKPKEAGALNFGDLERNMQKVDGDFDLPAFAKRRENFHSKAGNVYQKIKTQKNPIHRILLTYCQNTELLKHCVVVLN